jgi:hypothetical protein
MTLHAITIRFWKNIPYSLSVVSVLIGTYLLTNYTHSANGIQHSSPQEYWTTRDNFWGGYHQIIVNQSDLLLIEQFPELALFNYDLMSQFHSANRYGVDLILQPSEAVELINTMNIGDIAVNQIKLVKRDDRYWTIGLFDSKTAKATNGYYFEQKDLTDRYWISILNTL